MHPTWKELAEFVRSRRKEAGLNQTRLGLLSGVGRRFISELESGAKPGVRLDKVDAVLRVFGVRLGIVDREVEGRDE